MRVMSRASTANALACPACGHPAIPGSASICAECGLSRQQASRLRRMRRVRRAAIAGGVVATILAASFWARRPLVLLPTQMLTAMAATAAPGDGAWGRIAFAEELRRRREAGRLSVGAVRRGFIAVLGDEPAIVGRVAAIYPDGTCDIELQQNPRLAGSLVRSAASPVVWVRYPSGLDWMWLSSGSVKIEGISIDRVERGEVSYELWARLAPDSVDGPLFVGRSAVVGRGGDSSGMRIDFLQRVSE